MSHIVTVQTKVKDAQAVARACARLGLAAPAQGTFTVYQTEATGLAVNLPGWSFPMVIDLASGEVKYDNYGGSWGDQSRLDSFLQMYAVEKATAEAALRGYHVTENKLANGSVHLQLRSY